MAVSNNITAFLNFLALLCSVPIIGTGIWLASKQDNECLRLARWPVVILGVLLLLVSLAGFVGAYWNRQGLLASYLFAMAALIVLLLILLVFAFVVTKPSGEYGVPGRGYAEYRVDGFSAWLRHYVADPGHWDRIRVCLGESDVCQKLSRDSPYLTADEFFLSPLSPLQTGCCKPPTACGYGYVNPTVWVNPSNPGADPDCSLWSNDQSQLCYNCNSCKAGMLGNLREEWRKANVALIVAAVALIFVYVIGCSAFKNAQTEDLFRRYKQGYV
ncbi:tetraspanin-2 [Typha latifolia]|uniref:tetraspanin-2 n=1 Tax=Typha latifolia TaxID=4733 RepID=UPI003C30B96E